MAARNTVSKGSKPDKLMRDAIMVALNREAVNADGKPTKNLCLVAEQLVTLATGGDIQAIKEVIDRIDGKAAQPVEHSGKVEHEHSGAAELLASRIAGLAARLGSDKASQTTH